MKVNNYIVIEGPRNSGKTTLAKFLKINYEINGNKVKKVKFPTEYPDENANAYEKKQFFVKDFQENGIKYPEEGTLDYVIYDRSFISTAVHQHSKEALKGALGMRSLLHLMKQSMQYLFQRKSNVYFAFLTDSKRNLKERASQGEWRPDQMDIGREKDMYDAMKEIVEHSMIDNPVGNCFADLVGGHMKRFKEYCQREWDIYLDQFNFIQNHH